MEKLFTYGTLQIPAIQQSVFGRTVIGTPDILEGYYKSEITMSDGTFPIIVLRSESSVAGLIIEVTPDELILMDRYETNAYRRIKVTLKSGEDAWVYCE